MSLLSETLAYRFGGTPPAAPGTEILADTAARGSVRRFRDAPVAPDLVETLAAVALCSPTKSDLQQRDIVIVRDPDLRAQLDALVSEQAWIAQAPAYVVVCGNNRRQRIVQEMSGHPFANDHLDALVNAVGDAAIALGALVAAAEAVGLGACPVSAVRNRAAEVSDLLGLPDHVFPFAGLALGWPEARAPVSPRLPLAATVHTDRYDETGIEGVIADYDARRAELQPFRRQRRPDLFGEAETYTWSEDKARQYALPERADFGAFIRDKGFCLD